MSSVVYYILWNSEPQGPRALVLNLQSQLQSLGAAVSHTVGKEEFILGLARRKQRSNIGGWWVL